MSSFSVGSKFAAMSHSRFARVAVAVLSAFALPVAARADAPTFPTVDWATGLQSILTQIGAVLSTAWPYIALILALFIGVRIVMNLPRRAAK